MGQNSISSMGIGFEWLIQRSIYDSVREYSSSWTSLILDQL